MFADLFAYGIDLHKRAVHRFGAGHFAGIHMEKKIALRLPSRMRGMSMLPVEVRAPRIEFSVEEALRRVIVRVYDDGRKVQLPPLVRNAVRSHCNPPGARQPQRTHLPHRIARNHFTSPCSPIALPASLY